MVYMKTYIFNDFYQQYLVLLTMVPRNSRQGKERLKSLLAMEMKARAVVGPGGRSDAGCISPLMCQYTSKYVNIMFHEYTSYKRIERVLDGSKA